MEIIQPDGWPRGSGYSNGVAATGRVIAVAGQIGWDPRTQRLVSDAFVPQVRQALQNILDVLHAGGAGASDVIRLTWYITDRDAYLNSVREIGAAYRDVFGKNFPAMSVVVVEALLERGAMVEIDATAVV